jgi:uncharacterized protein YjiS (DUF1127 family)
MPKFATVPHASPHAGPALIGGGFAAALRRWWNRLDEERRLRVTINSLRALDDRTLRDIGVERDDIVDVVRENLLR